MWFGSVVTDDPDKVTNRVGIGDAPNEDGYLTDSDYGFTAGRKITAVDTLVGGKGDGDRPRSSVM